MQEAACGVGWALGSGARAGSALEECAQGCSNIFLEELYVASHTYRRFRFYHLCVQTTYPIWLTPWELIVWSNCSLFFSNIYTHLELFQGWVSWHVCLQLPALQALYRIKISNEFLHFWLMCKVGKVPVIFREVIKSLDRIQFFWIIAEKSPFTLKRALYFVVCNLKLSALGKDICPWLLFYILSFCACFYRRILLLESMADLLKGRKLLRMMFYTVNKLNF